MYNTKSIPSTNDEHFSNVYGHIKAVFKFETKFNLKWASYFDLPKENLRNQDCGESIQ